MSKNKHFIIEDIIEIKDSNIRRYGHNFSFSEFRGLNLRKGRPLNFGLPHFEEEKILMGKMYRDGCSLMDLQDYFQRPKQTVKKIMKEMGCFERESFLSKTSKATLEKLV